jgi:acetyltransferase EpsM
MVKDIIILGGIGNGTVIADAIDDTIASGVRGIRLLGFLNDRQSAGTFIEKWPVLGSLSEINYFIDQGCCFVYTIYRIDGQAERIDLFRKLSIPDEQLFTFVHPLAYVAPTAHLSAGSVLMPNAAVSAGAEIGKCSLVMVGATIGHNSLVGDHCHLAAQACLSSNVKLAEGVHIGLNTTVGNNLTLGKFSTLGMGSVLLSDIPEKQIWVGNPASFLRNAQ